MAGEFDREVNIEELAALFRGGARRRRRSLAARSVRGEREGKYAAGRARHPRHARHLVGDGRGQRRDPGALARPYDRGILALVLLVPSTVVTLVKLGVSQATVYYINRKEASVDRVASNSVILALGLGVLSAVDRLAVARQRSTVLRDVPTWALALALVRVPLLLLDNYLFSVLQATGQFGVYNTRLLISEALRLVLVAIFVMWLNLGLFARRSRSTPLVSA